MYKKQYEGWLKHLDFLLIDLICFHLAFWGSYIIRHGWTNPWGLIMYRNLALVSSIILVFVVAWTNPFSDVLRRGYYREMIEAAKTVFFVMLLVLAYLFVVQLGDGISRMVLIGTGVGYYLFACLFRNLWKLFLRRRHARLKKQKRLVLVTTSPRAREVIRHIQETGIPYAGLAGVAIVSAPGEDERLSESISDVPIVAGDEDIIPYLTHGWADEVFLDLDESTPGFHEISEAVVQMGIVTHRRLGESGDYLGRDKVMQYIGGYPVVTVGMKIMTPRQAFAKRFVDIVFGIAGCIATILLTVVIGPIIFIKSPGNIFFSQIRVGRNGKPFRMYKFRSMYPDAEERKQELAGENIHSDGMMFKVEQDPRIIGSKKRPGKGIGYFIRRTSVDEFPQFFNVLIGQMSLIGTRPPTTDEWEKYELRHRSRMSIKPGITGLWQVSGRSEIVDFDEVTRLDCEYIENWSMKQDVIILFKTLGAVFRGKGAK